MDPWFGTIGNLPCPLPILGLYLEVLFPVLISPLHLASSYSGVTWMGMPPDTQAGLGTSSELPHLFCPCFCYVTSFFFFMSHLSLGRRGAPGPPNCELPFFFFSPQSLFFVPSKCSVDSFCVPGFCSVVSSVHLGDHDGSSCSPQAWRGEVTCLRSHR